MDGDSTLKLGKNEQTVNWVLERLRHDKSRKASTLAIFQAVPLYYAAVAVKQYGTKSSMKRDALLADRYKRVTAPAFLKFLREEYDFQTPRWLTMDLMGQTTFADDERKYYDPTKGAVWDRYQQAGRDIRKTVTPWINKWMAKSGFGETLSSGRQYDELMQGLHEHLWRNSTPGAAKKMGQAEFERRSAKGECLEVVDDDDDDEERTPSQVGDDPGSTEDGTEEPTRQEGGGSRGASNPTDGTSPANEDSGQGGGGDSGDSSGNPPSTGSPRPTHPDHVDTMVTVRAAMPKNWVHRYSLVICYFSKISNDPDPDLDLSSSKAPPSKKARVSDAGSANTGESGGGDGEDETGTQGSETGDGMLSRRSLNLLGKVNESHGKKDLREKKDQVSKEFRMQRCLEAFAERLSSSRDQTKDVLAESVRGMASAMRDAGNIRRERFDIERRHVHVEERSKKIEWLKLEICTLEEMGMAADAQKTRMRLVTLLRQPLPCDAPFGPGDAGSGDGGSSNGDYGGGACSGAADGSGAIYRQR